jgi:hypothetical protein
MNTAAIRLTGVGCFARGITLSRVLRRMMAAYSLGNFGAVEGFRKDASPAVQVLQNLMRGGSGSSAQVTPDLMDEEVAGFFLNFDNESLNLSVFTRSRGRPCRKYTASLEELTRLRQSRLH